MLNGGEHGSRGEGHIGGRLELDLTVGAQLNPSSGCDILSLGQQLAIGALDQGLPNGHCDQLGPLGRLYVLHLHPTLRGNKLNVGHDASGLLRRRLLHQNLALDWHKGGCSLDRLHRWLAWPQDHHVSLGLLDEKGGCAASGSHEHLPCLLPGSSWNPSTDDARLVDDQGLLVATARGAGEADPSRTRGSHGHG